MIDSTQPYAMTGQFTQVSGTTLPVFLRFRQGTQEKERVALQLLQEHAFPAPHFLGRIQVELGTLLLQSYIEGSDFATLLPVHLEQPPLPIASSNERRPVAPDDLLLAMEELGQAIQQLHQISLPQFGHLSGPNPNPHRSNARLFTLQEAQQALERCVRSQWIHPGVAPEWKSWLDHQCELLDEDERACLIHADLHVANIRFQRSPFQKDGRWSFAGVIDFEHAKAWLREFDLVLLRWQVSTVSFPLWEAFLQGYGHDFFPSPDRIKLFEIIKLFMILGGHEKDTAYGRWAWKMLPTHVPW